MTAPLKCLFIAKQGKNIDAFENVLAALLMKGHAVTLAVMDRDHGRERLVERFATRAFAMTTCPEGRSDEWRSVAPLVRRTRDYVQYLKPPYREAGKLRQRALHHLVKELAASQPNKLSDLLTIEDPSRLEQALTLIERAIPVDPAHDEFIKGHDPDLLIVTPGVHFGSTQADFIKAARARGIPTSMLLFSWDNLSTKGALHERPDLMFVWNERQRQEAAALHGFSLEHARAVGAPRFDEFFTLRSKLSRQEFFAPLALDHSRPTFIYLCSSRFIAERELTFLEQWLAALRRAGPALASANIIIRPHPDVTLAPHTEAREVSWSGLPGVGGRVQRPFDDPAVLILRTSYNSPQAFFECLHHSAAAVALNTSAELEAAIVGRPVYTVLSSEKDADGQLNTLHFNYLLKEHGGIVHCAADLDAHMKQLAGAIEAPPRADDIQAFARDFLRPHVDGQASEALATALIANYGGRRTVDTVPTSTSLPAGLPVVADDAPNKGDTKRLRLHADAAISVYSTPETKRWRKDGILATHPAIVKWLHERVQPGEVFFDIGAGIGAYALLGATQRAALTVAFEPGFASFKRLCDNVVLNGCGRRVIPLPIALAGKRGLFELVYSGSTPGDERHSLRARRWKSGEVPGDGYTQPVCAEQLDDVITRYQLPWPNAMRIAVHKGAGEVLAGASRTLASSNLNSILISVSSDAEVNDLAALAAAAGFAGHTTAVAERHETVMLLERVPTVASGA